MQPEKPKTGWRKRSQLDNLSKTYQNKPEIGISPVAIEGKYGTSIVSSNWVKWLVGAAALLLLMFEVRDAQRISALEVAVVALPPTKSTLKDMLTEIASLKTRVALLETTQNEARQNHLLPDDLTNLSDRLRRLEQLVSKLLNK
jgi:hypothetical protein